ncbi:MAG: class I SAM-dependent methyltransferase [Bacteroidota bacterium]|nr:class I SAM-dependent methyltransferase [Bacteroidota bacterium]
MALVCKICHNDIENQQFTVREMMFGFREGFSYFQCSQCGCIQILERPENMDKYYPEGYYSFAPRPAASNFIQDIKKVLYKQLIDHYLGNHNLIGKLLSARYKNPFRWIRKNMLSFDSAILDVGCGSGKLPLLLHQYGFKNITGIDPYNQEDIFYRKEGINIFKKEIFEMEGQFDFIILHSSFEHMWQPLDVMKNLHRLLKPGGHIMIRIPVANSYAWRKYGINWVNFDAPRHFFLHTVTSIKILADQSNLKLTDVDYDSYELQFWGSEQYLRNIPLVETKGKPDYFSPDELKVFRKESMRLNRIKDGDTAFFYLSKVE